MGIVAASKAEPARLMGNGRSLTTVTIVGPYNGPLGPVTKAVLPI